MPRILFGVSPIGLGHATRALVLAAELRKRGADVRLFSGGKPANFIRRGGVAVDDIVSVPYLRISNGEMSQVVLWYLSSWVAHRRTLGRTRKLVEEYDPDVVVGDEEFSGVTVAGEKGVKRVFISDELSLGFGRTWLAERVERRVEGWYTKLLDSVDVLIIPESGDDSANRRYVGPIVRPVTMSCSEVRGAYALPEGRMVLFSMSGSGAGRELAERALDSVRGAEPSGVYFVVTGNRGRRITGEGVYDLGVVEANQDLVACADLVISNAGKSTIDEAAAAGTPIIVIPIRHHAEQERNAQALGFSYDDIGRLQELAKERLGRRGDPRPYAGEKAAADAILSLAAGG